MAGLDDLYAKDNLAAATAAGALPPEAAPPKRGAWGGVLTALPRGVTEAAAQVMGTAADVGNAFTYMRDATPEQRRQIDRGGVPVEQYTSDLGDTLRDVGRDFRPDPQTASTAESVVYGFSRGAAKIVGGAVAAGPLGVGLAAAEEAFTQSDEMKRAGVDLETRSKVGLVQGAGLALAALPIVGQTAWGTAGLYAVGGPGGFMAQQAMTREILARANYGELAKQFDPLDPLGLAVSALIPLPFVAMGLRGNLKAGAKPVADAPAGPPAPPHEVIDAAMVQNLTLHGDAVGDTAMVPRAGSLSTADDLAVKTAREANAQALDEKAQIDAEAEHFQLVQQAIEGRVDSTGDMFGAHMQSVADRVATIETDTPDLIVRQSEDGTPIRAADELAAVRRLAAEGDDADLGALDADLLRVAADCALRGGMGA